MIRRFFVLCVFASVLIQSGFIQPSRAGAGFSRPHKEENPNPEYQKVDGDILNALSNSAGGSSIQSWAPAPEFIFGWPYSSLPTLKKRGLYHSLSRLVLQRDLVTSPGARNAYFHKGNMAFSPFNYTKPYCRMGLKKKNKLPILVPKGTEVFFARIDIDNILSLKGKEGENYFSNLYCYVPGGSIGALQETLGDWFTLELLNFPQTPGQL